MTRFQQSSQSIAQKMKEVFTDHVRLERSFLEGGKGADPAYHGQRNEAHLKSNVAYLLRQGSRASCYPSHPRE